MSAISCPKLFLLATAALAPASAFNAHHTTRTTGRPSSLRLEANNEPFSELDKLKAKRLDIRRPHLPDPEVDAAAEKNRDIKKDVTNDTPGLEYLCEAGEERHTDDFFHIILMKSTFYKDHMSIEHATASCIEILDISPDKAHDLSLFAKHQGFSCLGTWTREECLDLGDRLLSHDLDCRVVPFNGGVVPESLPDIQSLPEIRVADVVDAPADRKVAFVDDTYLFSL